METMPDNPLEVRLGPDLLHALAERGASLVVSRADLLTVLPAEEAL